VTACPGSPTRSSIPTGSSSSTRDRAELFLYDGDEHLFADSSLPVYDPAAAALLIERVLAFLGAVEADEESGQSPVPAMDSPGPS